MEPSQPFRAQTVEAFVQRLASAEPVPGGGSASAVAGALGAGLVAMVASLSLDRPKYAEHAALHRTAIDAGRALADTLLALADADAAAYGTFAAALRLPRDSEDEQAARRAALEASARTAAEIPLRCVEACGDVVRYAEALAGRSNRNAASDLAVAARLATAAAEGAAANVRVNLPATGDAAFSAAMEDAVRASLARIHEQATATIALVESGATRPPFGDPTGS